MHFPASKEELLERARDSGAGQDVIEVLEFLLGSRGIPNCGRRHEGLWRSRSSAANRDHRSEAVRGAHGSAAKFARCGKAGGDWPSARILVRCPTPSSPISLEDNLNSLYEERLVASRWGLNGGSRAHASVRQGHNVRPPVFPPSNDPVRAFSGLEGLRVGRG